MKKLLSTVIAASLLLSTMGLYVSADESISAKSHKSGIKKAIKALKLKSPRNEEFKKYQEALKKGALHNKKNSKNGLIPEPMTIGGKVQQKAGKHIRLGLPSKYDLRKKGKMTPVKDQGPNGSCWAFAAYASLESTMMPELNDFSEKNMRNTHGFDSGPDDGGNRYMSTAYMARWSGPINESDEPYSPYDFHSPTGLKRAKDLMTAVYLPDIKNGKKNIEVLKNAIKKYGAVETCIRSGNQYLNRRRNAHYNNNSMSRPNHAVTISGWDDNYSKNNFLVAPPTDGAWLVKNSWGADWGNNGYYWVSYHDVHIGTRNVQYRAQDKGEFDKLYLYDKLGITDGIGETTGYYSNVYKTGNKPEKVNAIGLDLPNHDTNYKIYIVKNYKDQSSFKDKIELKSGHFDYAGYYVVKLDEAIEIPANTKFAPVIYSHSGDIYTIPIENKIEDYTSRADAHKGESFTSTNGVDFVDLTKEYPHANVCLKTFTKVVDNGEEPVVKSIKATTDKDSYFAGETVKIIATVKDNYGKNIANEQVNLQIKNYKKSARTNRNGEVTFKFATSEKIKEGTYTAKLALANDKNVKTSVQFEIIEKVNPNLKESLELNSDKAEYKAGDNIMLNATLKDKKGNTISWEKVTFEITKADGQKVIGKDYTNYSGIADYVLKTSKNDKAGNFTIKASANLYNKKVTSKTLTVKVIGNDQPEVNKATLNIQSDKKSYKLGDIALLTATLKNNSKPVDFAKVTFEITTPDGKKRTGREYTNKNGVATYRKYISRYDEAGIYTIVANTTVNNKVVASNSLKINVTNPSDNPEPDPQPEPDEPATNDLKVTLKSDKPVYDSRYESAKILVVVKNSKGQALQDTNVKLTIVRPNGRSRNLSLYTNRSGKTGLKISALSRGKYQIKAKVLHKDYKNTTKSISFTAK